MAVTVYERFMTAFDGLWHPRDAWVINAKIRQVEKAGLVMAKPFTEAQLAGIAAWDHSVK